MTQARQTNTPAESEDSYSSTDGSTTSPQPSSITTSSGGDQVVHMGGEQAPSVASVETPTNQDYLLEHDLCRTAITLQYGPDLARERVVHLEVLCPASEKMTTLFNESKPLMIKYRQASTLLEKINRFLEDTVPDDMDEHHTKQARLFVQRCAKQYPLSTHQRALTVSINEHIGKQFKNKNTSGLRKNDAEKLDLAARFQHLTPEGVRELLKAVRKEIKNINRTEVMVTRQNKLRAAAQHRIMLPDFEHETIVYVSNWLYTHELLSVDAKQLCKVYGLAEELGLQVLADSCMSTLSTAADAAIISAKAEGKSVRDLLCEPGHDSDAGANRPQDSLAGVVGIVFRYVLKQNNPPVILRKFVIDAIADSQDRILLHEVKSGLTRDMALELMEAMMLRNQREPHGFGTIKTEIQDEHEVRVKAEAKDATSPSFNTAPHGTASNHVHYER